MKNISLILLDMIFLKCPNFMGSVLKLIFPQYYSENPAHEKRLFIWLEWKSAKRLIPASSGGFERGGGESAFENVECIRIFFSSSCFTSLKNPIASHAEYLLYPTSSSS